MELHQLQYFVAIAESGSLTKAASTLYVTQPSLSASIKKLEKELGVVLFERRWRGVRLTSAGEVFLGKAQTILAEYQATVDALRNFQERPVLRLGILCTIQVQIISTIIQSFRELYPEVTVELHDTHLDELNVWLSQGRVDLIITVLDEETEAETAQQLFKQRLLLAVPSSHPYAKKQAIMLTELNDQPYIDRIKCEILAKQSPSIFEVMNVHPHIVYRADHEEWVISLIQAGMGMSIMPEWTPLDGVTYVPLANMEPMRQLGLRWKAEQNVKLVHLFRTFLAEGTWFDVRFQALKS